MVSRLILKIHTAMSRLGQGADSWFLGLFARFVFLAVLFFYYLNAAGLKVEDGFAGFFQPSFGGYIQILSEQGLLAYDMEIANLPFYLHAIVYAGTYTEFLLPILIVIGLFTRLAALAMIVFVIVQSYVDIAFHGVEAQTIGKWFDIDPGSAIMDQRLFWIFLLTILTIKGAGKLSLDHLVVGRLK